MLGRAENAHRSSFTSFTCKDVAEDAIWGAITRLLRLRPACLRGFHRRHGCGPRDARGSAPRRPFLIRQGAVTASLILRKLDSYLRQNSLAAALREIGRIERTLFYQRMARRPRVAPTSSGWSEQRRGKKCLSSRSILQPARRNLGRENVIRRKRRDPLRGASDAKIKFPNALPSGLVANDNWNH